MIPLLQKALIIVVTPVLALFGIFTPIQEESPSYSLDISNLEQTVLDLHEDQENDIFNLNSEVDSLQEEQVSLGASGSSIPTPIALFETTLQSKITANDTSFTLTSATDKDGNTLASSTYAFIIDEGSSNEEMVIADCTGTACTGAIRGISVLSGTTSVASLKKSHRRGASIKITDGPQLLILSRLANGIMLHPNILQYNTDIATTSFSRPQDIPNKDYVDSIAFNGAGVIDATESDEGVVELATQSEMASSTSSGSEGPLVLQAKNATSSAPSSGHYVPVTGSDGNLDQGFLPTTITQDTEFTGTTTLATTTVLGYDPINFINGAFATSSTATVTIPVGITKIKVKVWAAGGAGQGSEDTDSTPPGDQNQTLGTPGNYAEAVVDVSPGDQFAIVIGAAGTKSAGYSISSDFTAAEDTTVTDVSGASAFSMTVKGGNTVRIYGTAGTISGTKLVTGTDLEVIGGGSGGGTFPVPNNSSAQSGGTGQSARVVIEY